jgi:hypothetical protein
MRLVLVAAFTALAACGAPRSIAGSGSDEHSLDAAPSSGASSATASPSPPEVRLEKASGGDRVVVTRGKDVLFQMPLGAEWKVGGTVGGLVDALNEHSRSYLAVTIEPRVDASDAVRRLGEIEKESRFASTSATTCGWPSVERREEVAVQTPNNAPPPRIPTAQSFTFAVAIADVIVRVEGHLEPGAPASGLDEIAAMTRTATCASPG